MGGGITPAVIFATALWAIGIYNGLVQLRNRYKNSFAQSDVQLKRRYDLIPNLVEAAGAVKNVRTNFFAIPGRANWTAAIRRASE